jgi:hypothetical protein
LYLHYNLYVKHAQPELATVLTYRCIKETKVPDKRGILCIFSVIKMNAFVQRISGI